MKPIQKTKPVRRNRPAADPAGGLDMEQLVQYHPYRFHQLSGNQSGRNLKSQRQFIHPDQRTEYGKSGSPE